MLKLKTIIVIIGFSMILFGCQEQPLQPLVDQNYSLETTEKELVSDIVNDSLHESETLEDFQLKQLFGCLKLEDWKIKRIKGYRKEAKLMLSNTEDLYNNMIKNEDEILKTKLEKYEGVETDSIIIKEINEMISQHDEKVKYLRRSLRDEINEQKSAWFTGIGEWFIDNEEQLSIWNTWRATGKVPCLNDK